MDVDLRLAMLVFGAISFILWRRLGGDIFDRKKIEDLLLNFVFLITSVGTVVLFVSVLARIDPTPSIRYVAYAIGLRQLLSFEHAIPDDIASNVTVQDIDRIDTDGDGFPEWVVFYRFDKQGVLPGINENNLSPVQIAVYDNDRGNPPVVFPYILRAPGRDYLSEGITKLYLAPVTIDRNGPDGGDLDEIVVEGRDAQNVVTSLAMFRFQQNSERWDFPRDAPARYQPIGLFRAGDGISFDSVTKRVTTIDRSSYERSQMVVRSIYELNPATNSYLDSYNSTELAAPVVSTLDFVAGTPSDILESAYPEKIVLGFLASLCGGSGDGLCRNSVANAPTDFLQMDSDAYYNYVNGEHNYFGIPSATVADIFISNLRYYPEVETDPDLLQTGRGRDVVTGEESRYGVVDVTFSVAGSSTSEVRRFELNRIKSQWKIYRLAQGDLPPLGSVAETATTSQ